MEILTAIKAMLKQNAPVVAALKGGIWNNQAAQDDDLPNIVLMLIGGADGWTQDGPTGLYMQTLRVMYRGKNDAEVAILARLGTRALNNRSGLFYGMNVQQCRRTQSTSDFNEQAKVQRQIDSYVVTWRYTSEP